jgi:hypothetical protein
MASKTAICNLALSNLGISQFIIDVDLPSEKSNQARTCRLWYDQCVQFALEDFDWNFARKRIPLAEIDTTPPSVWAKVYAYPSNCAAARYIEVPGNRRPTIDERIPFEVASETNIDGGDYKVIYTDVVQPVLVYTKLITDPNQFDAQFVMALSWLLAANIAMPLSVKPSLGAQAAANYQASKQTAIVKHFTEEEEGADPPSEAEIERNS